MEIREPPDRMFCAPSFMKGMHEKFVNRVVLFGGRADVGVFVPSISLCCCASHQESSSYEMLHEGMRLLLVIGLQRGPLGDSVRVWRMCG